MRQPIRWGLLATAALLLALPASAGDDDNRSWRRQGSYRDDDGYYQRGPYSRGYDAVDRALSDLERLRSYRWVDHHERDHFERARRDLLRFSENRARGRFDKDRLDGAIENMQHLANADQVHPRDRQVLRRDLAALRDYRARGGYSYRRSPGW